MMNFLANYWWIIVIGVVVIIAIMGFLGSIYVKEEKLDNKMNPNPVNNDAPMAPVIDPSDIQINK